MFQKEVKVGHILLILLGRYIYGEFSKAVGFDLHETVISNPKSHLNPKLPF